MTYIILRLWTDALDDLDLPQAFFAARSELAAHIPAAALVSMADYQALEDAADVVLAREAAAVLREESDGRRYSLAEVIADVFAEQTDAA